MRLISKWHDYYDSLQDPTNKRLTYIRNTQELDCKDPSSLLLAKYHVYAKDFFRWRHPRLLGQDAADAISSQWNGQIVPKINSDWYMRRIGTDRHAAYHAEILLFCGKLYRGLRYSERWSDMTEETQPTKVYWTREAFEKDHFSTLKTDHKGRADKYLKDIFRVFEASSLMDVHFTTQCPALQLIRSEDQKRELTALLNPRLQRLQFYRVMDAPTVFQELSMFIGGVLSRPDTPNPVPNKYKILSHGFDLKSSFRKDPTKEHR